LAKIRIDVTANIDRNNLCFLKIKNKKMVFVKNQHGVLCHIFQDWYENTSHFLIIMSTVHWQNKTMLNNRFFELIRFYLLNLAEKLTALFNTLLLKIIRF
jgi:hypothetical protein